MIENGWWSSMWKLHRLDDGAYRIENRWKPGHFLHIENGRLELGRVQPGWHSARWVLRSALECSKDYAKAPKLETSLQSLDPRHSLLAMNDPRQSLLTINCHGSYRAEKFRLEAGIFVLIPHRDGLDRRYTTISCECETGIYLENRFEFPHGWRLYKPGDWVNNQSYSTWKNPPQTNGGWGARAVHHYGYNYSSARWGTFQGFTKCKIVLYRRSSLKEIATTIRQHLKLAEDFGERGMKPSSQEPIILFPNTCNSGSNNITLRKLTAPSRPFTEAFKSLL